MTLELIKGNSPFLHPPRNCCFHSAEPTAPVNSFMLQKCRYELAYVPVNTRDTKVLCWIQASFIIVTSSYRM